MTIINFSSYNKIWGYTTKPVEYDLLRFSGGELHVRLKNPEEVKIATRVNIRANIHSSDDLMEILLVNNAIRQLSEKTQTHLYLPYLPYARQDRVCYPGEALSLEVIVQVLRTCNFTSVEVADLHNPDTRVFTKYSVVINNTEAYELISQDFFSGLRKRLEAFNITIIAPDAGAAERARKVANKITKVPLPFRVAEKIRNSETGEITGTKLVPGPSVIKGTDVLIVDDICDGGRTFVELAKILHQEGAKSVSLYVTHGIFSKGFEPFGGLISTVHCPFVFNEIEAFESADLHGVIINPR
jgi:ribose-phosphate pyrophosphokinase